MNAIRHNRIGVVTNADGSIDVVVPAAMAEDFKLLVKRGTNTYPSQHIEIRDFADRLNNPDVNSPCMKQELYGYPTYGQWNKKQATVVTISPEEVKQQADIIRDHWDIPSSGIEDATKQLQEHFNSTIGSSPIGYIVEKGTVVATIPAAVTTKSHCDGHPETCNCDYHAG